MPSPAKVFPAFEPRIDLVYSREDFAGVPLPDRVAEYPELRYMGSKHRLLPWIHGVLRSIPFETAADPFVGSGCVAELLKAMGKRVIASDFLNFPTVLAEATVANSKERLDGPATKKRGSRHRMSHHPRQFRIEPGAWRPEYTRSAQ